MILAALIGAGVMLAALSMQLTTTNLRGKELKLNRSVEAAKQANLSAINYLNAALRPGSSGLAKYSINNNLAIVGQSTQALQVSGGGANFYQFNPDTAAALASNQAITGNVLNVSANNATATRLQVIKGPTPCNGYNCYDVRATTTVAGASPVSTVGRIKLLSCDPPGKPYGGYCYYYSGVAANCGNTCSAKGKSFDTTGTLYATSSDAICGTLLNLFGAPAGPVKPASQHPKQVFMISIPQDVGCKYYDGTYMGMPFGMTWKGRWRLPTVSANESFDGVNLVCGCK